MPPYTNKPSLTSVALEWTKRHKKLILLFGFLLIVLFVASQYSFINLNMSKVDEKSISISFDDGKKIVSDSTTNMSYKKLIKKGTYQITVKSDDKNSFLNVTLPGFLQTKSINVILKEESALMYVGNSPSSCLSPSPENIIISWQCGGMLKNAYLHTPASEKVPSYSKSLIDTTEPIKVQGVIQKTGKTLIFAHYLDENKPEHGVFSVNTATGKIDISNFKTLSELNEDKDYGATPYKDGHLIYSLDGSEFWYYKDFNSPGQKVEINQTGSKSVDFKSVSVYEDVLIILKNKHYEPGYTEQLLISSDNSVISKNYYEAKDEGVSTKDSPIDYSEVVVSSNNKSELYKIDYPVSQALLCGKNRLCIVSDDNLIIFQIDGSKLNKLETIKNVRQVSGNGNKIFAATKQGILEYDIDRLVGNYVYTFGDYVFCGLSLINKASTKPYVCVSKNNRSDVLLIDNDNTSNHIDKKILSLRSLPEIQNVSVYKNSIFITPKINKMVFDRSLSSNIYDPREVNDKKLTIMKQVESENIDQSKYIIHFTTD